MHAEEEAFIRVIRERPDDDAARLVYADWLDDRDDPRAAYLRAEAEWAALRPADEQHRPLYRRVSQLAAGLDPEWFAAVSQVGYLVRREWQRFSQSWEPYRGDITTEPIRDWLSAKRELETVFSRFVGPAATDRRFRIPADYLAFVTSIPGSWESGDGWEDLYSPVHAAERAADWGRVFGGAPNERLELWVHVANTGDMHHHYLCCDLASPRFGEVAEGEDYHPWMDSRSSPLLTHGTTFLQFLREYWPSPGG